MRKRERRKEREENSATEKNQSTQRLPKKKRNSSLYFFFFFSARGGREIEIQMQEKNSVGKTYNTQSKKKKRRSLFFFSFPKMLQSRLDSQQGSERKDEGDLPSSPLLLLLLLGVLEATASKGQRVPPRVILSTPAPAARVSQDDDLRLRVLEPLCQLRGQPFPVLLLRLLKIPATSDTTSSSSKVRGPDRLREKVEEPGMADNGDVRLGPQQKPFREFHSPGFH